MSAAGGWERLSAVLDRALDLAPAERARLLDQECGDDAAFRQEVEALLAAGERDGFLSRPVVDFAAPLLTADEAGEDSRGGARSGDLIGPYRLLSELGRGGMGAVWLAERTDGQFEQRVALKLVKRGMDSDEILHRFFAERRILARLQHDAIARLYDGGATPDGTPWFAMEHVEGSPITEWSVRTGATIEQQLDRLEQVASAVQFAHRNLVVHRDLKPSNVLVDVNGRVKLLDFGIAKLLDDDGAARTRTELRLMTPEYAAPEQLEGGEVTTSTDVWALGLLAHELLAGGRPEASAARRPGDSTAIDTRSPVAIDRRLPRELRQILARALAPEPERRYASAEAFGADLRRYRAGEPVQAHADSFGYRLAKFVRRHRVPVAASAAVLIALIVGLGVALRQRAAAGREAERAAAARDFLVRIFDAAKPSESHGVIPDAYALLESGESRIATELAGKPELAADLEETLGAIEAELGRFDRMTTLYTQAIAHLRESRPLDEARIARNLVSLADAALEAGDLEASERAVVEALEIDRRKLGDGHPDTAGALSILGSLRSRQGRLDEAESLLRSATATLRASAGVDDPRYYANLNSLAVLLQNRGRFHEGLEAHRELLAWSERNREPDDPERATDFHNIGTALARLDQVREAEVDLRKALEIRERMLPAGHGYTVATQRSLAALLAHQGRWDEAETLVSRARELESTARGERTRSFAAIERLQGRIAFGRGDLGHAVEPLERSVALWSELAGADFPSTLRTEAELAEIRLGRGDVVAAAAAIEAVIARQLASGAPPNDLVFSRTVAARAFCGDGRAGEALVMAEAATSEARTVWGERHSSLAAALVERARARRARGGAGDAEAAERDLAEARSVLAEVAPAGTAVAAAIDELGRR